MDGIDNSTLEATPPEKQPHKGLLYGAAAFTALVVLIAGVWLFAPHDKQDGLRGEIKGTIYLTLRTNEVGRSAGLFSYDLMSDTLKLLLNDESLNVTEHVSPDGTKGVYASVPLVKFSTGEGKVNQLYSIDLSSGDKKRITNSKTALKKNPEWSPDGKLIAFTAEGYNAPEVSGIKVADDTTVFVTDLDGNEFPLTNGTSPQWTPDGRVVVLRTDGLYLYDPKIGSGYLIWGVNGGKVFENMKLDISRDGKMIAWSLPDKGEVVLIKVSSWEPFAGEIMRTINTHGFWVVFSEDGKYLAVQEFDSEHLQSAPNPRIVIYEIGSEKFVDVLNLNKYDQKTMFVTDWRY